MTPSRPSVVSNSISSWSTAAPLQRLCPPSLTHCARMGDGKQPGSVAVASLCVLSRHTVCSPAPLATEPALPHWPAQPLCRESATPSLTDSRSVSRGEEELSDSFPQSGSLVWQCVFSTATHSTILRMLAVLGHCRPRAGDRPGTQLAGAGGGVAPHGDSASEPHHGP